MANNETVTNTDGSAIAGSNSITGTVESYVPVNLNVKTLIEAGAHFGHQTTKWNPKMTPFIYGERNGIHIINLDLTLKFWERAKKFIYDSVAAGGNILFVGTKQQSRDIIKFHADRCSGFYVTSRWLGGTLSNFQTIKNSIDRMRKLEELLVKSEQEDSDVKLHKKEKLMIQRQLDKLEANLGGIRNMKRVPEVIFVVDVNKEDIAVAEAIRLHIPVVSLVDTNCNPDKISYPVPSNDDAARTINLFVAAAADIVIEAKKVYGTRVPRNDENSSRDGGSETSSKSRRPKGARKQQNDAPAKPEGEAEQAEVTATEQASLS